MRSRCDPAADPSVPADDDRLAGEEDVRRPQHAVDRALTGPVAVVEEMLGERLVDRDHRVGQLPCVGHGAQADDAGRRLLRPAHDSLEELAPLRVELVDEVGAVIHRHLRLMVERRTDVRVVGVAILALDGVGRDLEMGDERGGHVILRRQRVRRAQHRIGAAGGQGAHQVGRLGGDVEAGADPPALERSLGREPFADAGQHRHLPVRPFDLQPAGIGQAQVRHVGGLHLDSRCHGIRIASRIGRISPQPPARLRTRRSMSWQCVR